jgi:hypothetical protein
MVIPQRSALDSGFCRTWVAVLLGLLLSSFDLKAGEPTSFRFCANSPEQDIQKALDALDGGGEVVLGAGTYAIRQPIILQHDYEVLRGAGPNTILRLEDNANCPVVILGAPTLRRSVGHLRLADLLIDGNRAHQRVEFWRTAADGSEINNNGVEVEGATDAIIERVVCCRCRSGGLVTSAGTRRLTVRDFAAYDNQFDGLACYLTEDSHFSDLFIHDNLAAGISLDLAFNRNVIDKAVLSGNDLGIFMRDARDNVFSGLTICQCRHHGVFMAQAAAPTKNGWQLCPGTECTGNRFGALQIADCSGKPFLVNDASCTNNLFSLSALPVSETTATAPKLLDVRAFAVTSSEHQPAGEDIGQRSSHSKTQLAGLSSSK